MRINLTTQIDSKIYEELEHTCRNSTFYHSFKHISFLSDILQLTPKFLIAENNETIEGVLPFFEKYSTYGTVINSLPFFGSYGGCVSKNNNVFQLLLEEFNEYNKKNDILSSVIIQNPFLENNLYEKFLHFNLRDQRRIQCIKMEQKTTEDLWLNFEQRVRRSIRKSQKNDVVIEMKALDNTTASEFFSLHQKDMQAKGGKSKPKLFFKYLKDNFSDEADFQIYSAKKDELPIAYLLVFYFKDFVEYYMPAYDSSYKNLQAPSLLIWESIKEASKRKIKFYNFGGTWKNQEELYLFKRGWGSTDFFYNYYISGNIENAKSIGLSELQTCYPNFYTFPYEIF